MKKVYQRVIDPKNGDCMQAVFASLFEKEMNDVPKFIEVPDNKWFTAIDKFVKENGYTYKGMLHNKNHTRLNHPTAECFKKERWHMPHIMTKKSLYKYKGINGCFFASVFSPKYFKFDNPTTHAVIIDKDFNIVHDPSPKYKNIIQYPLTSLLDYNGVIDVWLIEPAK